MLFGTGLAFYLGKPLIQPQAPTLPALQLGGWSDIAAVRDALKINALFLVGVAAGAGHPVGAALDALGHDRAHGRR